LFRQYRHNAAQPNPLELHIIADMKRTEHALEVIIFNSRWLLAPFYLGLVVSIALLLVKFGQDFFHMLPTIFSMSESEVILAILTLVDMSLVANLLLIIIFSGYENFVSKIDTAGHEDRPSWMGKVDFSGLKVKLIASIVAISAIELAWKVGIHFVLIISGVLFALMDRIAEGTKTHHTDKHK
jgi:uncharacterized protein (TIGR00645 family)